MASCCFKVFSAARYPVCLRASIFNANQLSRLKGMGVGRHPQQPVIITPLRTCLSHVDDEGRASMVDTSGKHASVRTATASATVNLGKEVFDLVSANQIKKGDVLSLAQFSGIIAAKKTYELIPLCHSILLDKVDVVLRLNDVNHTCKVLSMVKTEGKTGVEMEALTAAVVAALTIYDMCKSVSKAISITDVMLLKKTGGKSGQYTAVPR